MGFNFNDIPTIKQAREYRSKYAIADNTSMIIHSNNHFWNNKTPNELDKDVSLHFVPSEGWKKQIKDGAYFL